jgi:nifR3 family TIM-barrel protein
MGRAVGSGDGGVRGGFHIGPVAVSSPVLLAPMAGITDLPFRRIAHRLGAGLTVSEMVASETLLEGHPETVTRAEGEGLAPHVVQLAGRDALWMAEGARAAEAGGADLIDINMGCPAKRVISGASGAALMRDLDHALTLIAAVVGAVSVPVSLKMRLGWDDRSINAPELAARAVAAGVRMIIVHGRTRNQFYGGHADWGKVRAVREAVDVPLVVNGDIVDATTARAALAASGADAVMVGRGATGKPWLPGAIARALDEGGEVVVPPPGERRALLVEQYRAMLALYGTELGVRVARKHLNAALAGVPHPDAVALRQRVSTSGDPDEVIATVDRWFDGADDSSERFAA